MLDLLPPGDRRHGLSGERRLYGDTLGPQGQPTALATNATDFAGPPAVDALLAAGFRVLVHDRAFADPAIWSRFSAAHPMALYVAARDPASLIAAAWKTSERVDVIVSNDHYPAVHGAKEKASLDNLRRTLEVLVVEPFAFLQAASRA